MTNVPVTKRILCALALLAGLALFASPASAKCTIGDCWGAVAFGPGVSEWVVDTNNAEDAKALAMAKCSKCNEVLTFHNTCGAFVSGSPKVPGGKNTGWGTSRDKDKAVGEAMLQCQTVARNCELRVWACTAEKK
jgi:hypothetical protein